jgi:hypothetical protein
MASNDQNLDAKPPRERQRIPQAAKGVLIEGDYVVILYFPSGHFKVPQLRFPMDLHELHKLIPGAELRRIPIVDYLRAIESQPGDA